MRRFIIFSMLILLIALSPSFAYEDDFFDSDINFLENPFANQKIITDDEFDKTIEQIKGKKKEPSKFTKWLFGVKDIPKEVKSAPSRENSPSDIDIARNAIFSNNLICLSVSVMDDFGHIIPVGHYRVKYKVSKNGLGYITLFQSGKMMGCFTALPFKDNYKENALVYARLDYKDGDKSIKIIISDFSKTFLANAKIIK